MAAPARKKEIQLSVLVDPGKPFAILRDARRLYRTSYPGADFRPVDRAFRLTKRLYEGGFPGYLACAVDYHDFAHSASVFAATSRLLDGCELSGSALGPVLAGEVLVAAMLHDTGYIRAEGDTSGTGAQYTTIHVDRSSAVVLREREAFGLGLQSAARISRMILGTDLERPWGGLVFESEQERMAAEILATADPVGHLAEQVRGREDLLFLYYEFREAGIGGYDSAYDILTKTAGFYQTIRNRLDGTLGRVSDRMKAHFQARHGVSRDLYRETIARQMAYLDAIIADDSTNFRAKLRRLDLPAIERRGAPAPSDGS